MEIVGRAALSLQFYDEKLFTELIAPLKANKRLTSLIMQLLELYYYNEEFHNLAEQLSPNEEEGIVDNYDDYFKDISAFIAVMGNMEDTLEENVKQGLQSIIDTAESREDIDSEVWGRPVPRVASSIESIKDIEEEKVENDNLRIRELEDKLSSLNSTVERLMGVIGQQTVVQQVPYQGANSQMQIQYMQPVMANQYLQPMQQPVQQSVIPTNTATYQNNETVSPVIPTGVSEDTANKNNIEELEKVFESGSSQIDETLVNTENETKVRGDVDDNFTVNFTDVEKTYEESTFKINLTSDTEEDNDKEIEKKDISTTPSTGDTESDAKEKAKKSLNKLVKSLK